MTAALAANVQRRAGFVLGNHIQVVDYRDVQFTKAPEILRGTGLGGLAKSERALAELREKGLT